MAQAKAWAASPEYAPAKQVPSANVTIPETLRDSLMAALVEV